MTPRWWTDADEAELELLIFELIAGYHDHRGRCDEQPCPHLGVALEAVLGWRQARALRTRAVALRAREDLTDWTTEARASDREEAA